MDAVEQVVEYLPEGAGEALARASKGVCVTDVRLRAGHRPRAAWRGGECEFWEHLTPEALKRIVSAMLEQSLYAWEDELGEGYFTLPGGSRAGVTGRYAFENGRARLTSISSVCVRVAREVPGCSRELIKRVLKGGRAASALVLSSPGMGKTTMLRDAACGLSRAGLNVAIADERGEIAACRNGVPSLRVGERTDVADGLNKADAITRLIRSMSPDVIITDELGDHRDVYAVREAARMGVAVLASAHAGTLAQAVKRPMLRRVMREGSFEWAFVLGGYPGEIAGVYAACEGDEGLWRLS